MKHVEFTQFEQIQSLKQTIAFKEAELSAKAQTMQNLTTENNRLWRAVESKTKDKNEVRVAK
jgi:hypothetical protein